MSMSERNIFYAIESMEARLDAFQAKANELTTTLKGKKDESVTSEEKAQIYQAYQALYQAADELHDKSDPDFSTRGLEALGYDVEEWEKRAVYESVPGSRGALIEAWQVVDMWFTQRKEALDSFGKGDFAGKIGGKIPIDTLSNLVRSDLKREWVRIGQERTVSIEGAAGEAKTSLTTVKPQAFEKATQAAQAAVLSVQGKAQALTNALASQDAGKIYSAYDDLNKTVKEYKESWFHQEGTTQQAEAWLTQYSKKAIVTGVGGFGSRAGKLQKKIKAEEREILEKLGEAAQDALISGLTAAIQKEMTPVAAAPDAGGAAAAPRAPAAANKTSPPKGDALAKTPGGQATL